MRILIGGDVCPAYVTDFVIKGDAETLFGDVPSLFRAADRVIINFECAMTESEGKIKKCGPNLKTSPLCAALLKSVGVTDCALSNNHIFDFGVRGVRDTIRALEEAGLSRTGFGENYDDSRNNLVFRHEGKTVTVIDVCEHEYCYALADRMGARPFDPFDTPLDVRKAKEKSDYVIVLYHGGKEHCPYPSERLVKACRTMAASGADVVLCQHSHCIGAYEEWNGSHILYGQGNFHFCGHPFGNDGVLWNTGLLVQLDITDKLAVSFIPVESVTDKNGIRIAKGAIKKEITDRFHAHQKSMADGSYKDGFRAFCQTMPFYRDALKNADGGDMDVDGAEISPNEFFAHYLFCEAHQDVWRELFRLPWETRDPDIK